MIALGRVQESGNVFHRPIAVEHVPQTSDGEYVLAQFHQSQTLCGLAQLVTFLHESPQPLVRLHRKIRHGVELIQRRQQSTTMSQYGQVPDANPIPVSGKESQCGHRRIRQRQHLQPRHQFHHFGPHHQPAHANDLHRHACFHKCIHQRADQAAFATQHRHLVPRDASAVSSHA